MLDFAEPKSSALLISLMKQIWPVYVKIRYGNFSLKIDDDVFASFQRLKGKPVIICPNHSSYEDPDVLFGVSKYVKEQFNFLAARELFRRSHSIQFKWMQKIGCYSVERNITDIHAFRATRELLLSNNRVVIFPEGDISHQNDLLMPLGNGPEQIAFSVQEELRKRKIDQSIYVLPLVLKYAYSKDISFDIENVLQNIEKTLGLGSRANTPFVLRLKQAFIAMLDVLDQAAGLPKFEGNLNHRLFTLKEKLILEAKTFLQLNIDDSLNQICKIHVLKNKFAEMRWGNSEQRYKDATIFKQAKIYFDRLKIASNLIAVSEQSFDHDLTQEEAAELVEIIEETILDRSSLKVPDVIFVGAAPEIDVHEYSNIYVRDKKEGIQTLKSELAARLSKRMYGFEQSYKSQATFIA